MTTHYRSKCQSTKKEFYSAVYNGAQAAVNNLFNSLSST